MSNKPKTINNKNKTTPTNAFQRQQQPQDNIVEKLAIINIKQISSYLNTNIDRLSLILTCKKWFNSIDHIFTYYGASVDLYGVSFKSQQYVMKMLKPTYKQLLSEIVDTGYESNIGNGDEESSSFTLNVSSSVVEPNYIPKTITTLTVNYENTCDIRNGVIPSNVKILHLNQERMLDRDGNNVEYIEPNDLPDSLEQLSVSNSFPAKFKLFSIPSSLRVLEMGIALDDFSILPANLEQLTLYYMSSLSKENPLPKSLKSLTLVNPHQELQPGDLPDSLTSLELVNISRVNEDSFPRNLKTLKLLGYINKPIKLLGDQLETLILSAECVSAIASLPKNLKTLHVNHHYTHPLPALPASLQFIRAPLFTKIEKRSKYNHRMIVECITPTIRIKSFQAFIESLTPLVDHLLDPSISEVRYVDDMKKGEVYNMKLIDKENVLIFMDNLKSGFIKLSTLRHYLKLKK